MENIDSSVLSAKPLALRRIAENLLEQCRIENETLPVTIVSSKITARDLDEIVRIAQRLIVIQ